MARLRMQPAGRSKLQWLAIATVALTVGAALGVLLSQAPPSGSRNGASTGPDATASAPIAAVRDCCTAPQAFASPQAPATAPLAAAPSQSPADVYREARHYADCLARQEPERQAMDHVADGRYAVDPSGVFAAALIRAEQEQRAACQNVGPYEYRRVDALMR